MSHFSNSVNSVIVLLFFLLNSNVQLNNYTTQINNEYPIIGWEGSLNIKVASYNIRYAAEVDKKTSNGWESRKVPLAMLIQNNDIDIVGTQEGGYLQRMDLMSLLPDYDYVGYPYGSARNNGLYNAIASIIYKASDFEILKSGKFWYSETPGEESIGWDATDMRICTWAKMKHKNSGHEFYFFTSHFYWKHHTARENSGNVMVKKIKEIADEDLPIISTGDLNSEPNSPQIKDISDYLQDAHNVAKELPSGPVNTNLGAGNFKGPPKNRIDYIFVNKKVQVLQYSVLTDSYADKRYPSDHLPVVCDIILEK